MKNVSRAGPALAIMICDEIPAGIQALDALLKEASVTLIEAGTIQCGLYLILISGEVEPVERSVRRALLTAPSRLFDHVLLPDAEPRILPAIRDHAIRWPAPGDTAGIVQVQTPPRLLLAVDRALKGTNVELVELRLGEGLGGRAIASFWGTTPDVEAAVRIASESVPEDGAAGLATAIIRNVDSDLAEKMGIPTTFFKEWRG